MENSALNPEVIKVFLGLVGTVFSLLLGMNIYFVKKLVDKIDDTAMSQTNSKTAVQRLEDGMKVVKDNVQSVSNSLREIKSEIKDLRRVEIEVAVLKSHINPKIA